MYEDKGLHVSVKPLSSTSTVTTLEQLGVPLTKRKYKFDDEDLPKLPLLRYCSDYRGLGDA